jgi:PAS domain S-box-containing protein
MIIALDFRTVVFCTSALGAFIGVAMLYVTWRRKTYPGFHEWTLSYLAGALGLLCLGLYPTLPAIFSTILSNSLITVCFVLIGIGLKRYCNTRQQPWIDISAVVAVAVGFAAFTYYLPSVTARIIVISIVLGLLSIRNAIISIREIPMVLGSPNGLLTFTFVSMFLLFLVRACATPFLAANTNNLMSTGTFQSASVLLVGLLASILALALILINAQRFHYDLEQSEDRYRRLIEGIRNDYYLYSHDLNGVFTYLTPSVKDLLNADPKNIVGRNWRDVFLLSPADIGMGDRIDAECSKGQSPPPFEFSFQHPGRGKCTIETQKRPVFDNQGRAISIEGIAKDITKQKQVEKALRESEEKYRTVVENVGVGILTVQDLRVVFANSLVRNNLGVLPEDGLEQLEPFDFVHPDDLDMVMERHNARIRGDKVPPNYTFQILMPNGGSMWVEATDVRIDWKGRPATLNFVTDITQRKHMEAERDLLIQELQTALSELKTLSGLLPICANCKKIRDDSGYWTQVEQYIQERSQAQFSHSICPECIRELYPEVAGKMT